MTSKEALEILVSQISKKKLNDPNLEILDMKNNKYYTLLELFEITMKNLEILNILKRNITLYDGIIDFYRDEDRNINCKINTDDYEVIKEWLNAETK